MIKYLPPNTLLFRDISETEVEMIAFAINIMGTTLKAEVDTTKPGRTIVLHKVPAKKTAKKKGC